MELSEVALFGTASGTTCAAVVAVWVDRFQKVAASSIAIMAGILPWLWFLLWNQYLPQSEILSALAIFGAGPLFLTAFFLYGLGKRTPKRGVAAGAALVGMFLGGAFSITLFELLSRME